MRPSSVLGVGSATGVTGDAVSHLLGQVQSRAVALELVDDAQRVLVVAKAPTEALTQAAVEHLLADVPERRMPEVVAESDRLGQVLVQSQRARDRARDRRDLERVRQPRAVMVALGRDEHLRLVREPAKRLAVHDPVAIALKRGAQRAVLLLARALRRVGARRERGERVILLSADTRRECGGDGAGTGGDAHQSIWVPPPAAVTLSARAASRRVRSPCGPSGASPSSHPGPRRTRPRRRRARAGPEPRPSRCAGPRHARAATRRRRPRRTAGRAPAVGDHETVEDVLLGRGHDMVNRAHLLPVGCQHGNALLEHLIRDRQTLVHARTIQTATAQRSRPGSDAQPRLKASGRPPASDAGARDARASRRSLARPARAPARARPEHRPAADRARLS